MESDYEWYVNADLSEFSGKWIAILNKTVIASGKEARKVLEEVNSKYPKSKPLIAKISADTLIL